MLIETQRQHEYRNYKDAAADADETAEDARGKSECKNDRDFAHCRFVSSAHNFASVSERRSTIEDGDARLVCDVAREFVVVRAIDQLEARDWLAKTAEPVLHIVEQRESDRSEEQRDQQAQCLTADHDQRDCADRAVAGALPDRDGNNARAG